MPLLSKEFVDLVVQIPNFVVRQTGCTYAISILGQGSSRIIVRTILDLGHLPTDLP